MCSKVTNSVRISVERVGVALDLRPARPHFGPWYEMYYLEYRAKQVFTRLFILKISICNSEFPIKKVSTKSLNQQHYNSSALNSLLVTTIALLSHRGNTGGSGIGRRQWRCDPGGCGKPTIPAGIALRTLTAANDKTRKQFIGQFVNATGRHMTLLQIKFSIYFPVVLSRLTLVRGVGCQNAVLQQRLNAFSNFAACSFNFITLNDANI